MLDWRQVRPRYAANELTVAGTADVRSAYWQQSYSQVLINAVIGQMGARTVMNQAKDVRRRGFRTFL